MQVGLLMFKKQIYILVLIVNFLVFSPYVYNHRQNIILLLLFLGSSFRNQHSFSRILQKFLDELVCRPSRGNHSVDQRRVNVAHQTLKVWVLLCCTKDLRMKLAQHPVLVLALSFLFKLSGFQHFLSILLDGPPDLVDFFLV